MRKIQGSNKLFQIDQVHWNFCVNRTALLCLIFDIPKYVSLKLKDKQSLRGAFFAFIHQFFKKIERYSASYFILTCSVFDFFLILFLFNLISTFIPLQQLQLQDYSTYRIFCQIFSFIFAKIMNCMECEQRLNFNYQNKQREYMKSKSSNGKEVNSISSFIDSLLNSPPALSNPLKRPSSQKSMNDSIVISKEMATAPPKSEVFKLSPMKVKSKSQDKASQVFNNTKNYIEQISVQNSMLVSRTSEVTESRTLGFSNKTVKFRENLIARNAHYKREFARKDSRTPSILKRSQMLRNSASQFIISSNIINSRLQSHMDRQQQQSTLLEDREGRAFKTNQVVRKRYFTTLQRFEAKFSNKLKKNIKLRNDEKYKDQLFTPILSSVLRGGLKVQESKSEKFKWIRIPELYKDSEIVVVNKDEKSNILVSSEQSSSFFLRDAFNCIKNCKSILQKMFQFVEISEFGVYLVKIFQENVWKYVVVDDFIPVVENGGELEPYFIRCNKIDEDKPVQIWPYLLEKAYASYYANYQSLHFGNTLDFLEEITGISGEIFQYTSNDKKLANNNKRLKQFIQTDDSTFLGYIQSEGSYTPIQKNEQGLLTANMVNKRSSVLVFEHEHIYEYFDRVYVFNPKYWIYTTVSTVAINIKKANDIPRFDISLRVVKLTESGSLSISIRQKEKRFYQRSSLNYDYIWIRVILLQKQFDGDCRWINAKYSNSKSINFFNKLEAGEYYIIVLPQWKSSHCYELSLIINSNTKIGLTKKDYDDRQSLVEKGCCDLAQRYGKLHQINAFACNYSFIHEQIGVLIENINNQRYNGDIKINRSINGLKAAVDLVPFNLQFYQQKNNKLPFKTQISVYIAADKSYTVVLMMRGGVDVTFLKKFDFGK